MAPIQTLARPRPLLRSLRWRLPFSICALLVSVLATILWVAHREVESTLRHAGRDRAGAAAKQIADMLVRSLRTRMDETVRLRTDPTLRAYLQNPNDETREEARKILTKSVTQGPRRAELWNNAGSLVLEAVTPAAADSGGETLSFPAGAPPTREGITELRATGKTNFFDIVTEIRDGGSPGAARLGYLRRFGRITSTPGGTVKRLIGSDAIVKVGNGGVWTDFVTLVEAPPATGSGTAFVGASTRVEGTPWVVWLGFPHAVIVAPARTFMQRVTVLAFVVIAVSVALVTTLSVRLTRPLHALATASEGIAAGDYTQRVATDRGDEIGRLARAFNAMSDEIAEARHRLEARVAERTAELAAARHEAERANLAKSEFLSLMSHDLRTPLNSIIGFAQLLQLEADTPDEREAISQITKAGRHLLALINEVLDLARIEAGQMSLSSETVAVDEVVRHAVDLVVPLAAQRDIGVDLSHLDHCGIFVRADRQRLTQVLLNLLSNAVKYNRDGGHVSVSCATAGEACQIRVTDTGVGIPAALLQRLFTPFERLGADPGIEGTGLGLALCKRLAAVMGGRIGVESEVGRGTTFWVEMPIAEPLARQTEQPLPAAASRHIESEAAGTVLYIEDNPSNLRLIERVLARRPGVALLTALQGGIGIELARSRPPDLIFLDLHLPDMPGAEVLQRLRAHDDTAQIPVVILSADATSRQIERQIAAGASAYLTKPVDINEVLRLVDETLGTRTARNTARSNDPLCTETSRSGAV
jgi:signal transduction histidine kinase/ActR/RegA family two-component response regulator